MISAKDIEVRKRDDFDHHAVIVTGRLRLACDVTVDSFTLRHTDAPATLLNMAEEHVAQEIWHKLYGDLVRPLRELSMHVYRSAGPYGPNVRAEELCKQLNGMLRFPRTD